MGSLHNLRYYAGPFLGKLKRTTKTSFILRSYMWKTCCCEKIRRLRKNSCSRFCSGSVKIQASKNRFFCTDLLSDNRIIFCLTYAMDKGSIIINFRQLVYVILRPYLKIFKSVYIYIYMPIDKYSFEFCPTFLFEVNSCRSLG